MQGEVAQPLGAGQRGRLAGDALLHVAVGGDAPDVVVEQALALGGVGVEQAALAAGRHRHADRVADALAERAGGGLDAGGVAVLRVARGQRAPGAQRLEVVELEAVAGQVELDVEGQAGVPGGQDEPVAARASPGRWGRGAGTAGTAGTPPARGSSRCRGGRCRPSAPRPSPAPGRCRPPAGRGRSTRASCVLTGVGLLRRRTASVGRGTACASLPARASPTAITRGRYSGPARGAPRHKRPIRPSTRASRPTTSRHRRGARDGRRLPPRSGRAGRAPRPPVAAPGRPSRPTSPSPSRASSSCCWSPRSPRCSSPRAACRRCALVPRPWSAARWPRAAPTRSTATSTATSTRSCTAPSGARWPPALVEPAGGAGASALVLGVVSVGWLWLTTGWLPAVLALAAIAVLRRGLHDGAQAPHPAEHRLGRRGRLHAGADRLVGGHRLAGLDAGGAVRASSSSGRRRTTGRCRCGSATTTPRPACRCCRWSPATSPSAGRSSPTAG